VRSALNTKIIDVIRRRGLTHAQLATLAGTSRTRITAIANRNTKDISTDLMLRVLGAMGVAAKITFGRAA
jgi:predicted XRE-type DNA-binding protein